MTMRRPRKCWSILLTAAVALYAAWSIHTSCFGPNTCGPSEEAIAQYLEAKFSRDVDVLKVAQTGRVKAVLYQDGQYEPSDGRYIMLFERRLFGMRWRQMGMNTFGREGLAYAGSWHSGYPSRCEVAVYGDNRNGAVEGYLFADAPQVCRDSLESGYILDLYILDGIDCLPRDLQFSAPQ